MNPTFNLSQEQVTALTNGIVALLQQVLRNNQTEPSSTPTHTNLNSWQSASTTSVSHWTMEQYDWKPLRKWCVDRNIDIEKETVNGLQINSYPAQAWLEVYGIVLGKFNV